jgi:hypothetical protein
MKEEKETYRAYCDQAAWHYWDGSGISLAD